MRKFTTFALLFPILFALTVPVGSQTRPRRVTQPANDSAASNTNDSAASNLEQREQERPRAISQPTPAVREGVRRESRWPGILLGAGIALGAGRIGHGSSCSPSRGAILGSPRLWSPNLGR